MKEFWNGLIAANSENITSLQMIVRGILVFILGLVAIRIAGKRIFGKSAAFDIVIGIVIGSILSRAITGNSPLIPAVLTCFVLVFLNKLIGFLSYLRPSIGHFIKGDYILLYKDGKLIPEAMKKAGIGEHDISEALRTQLHTSDLNTVKEAYLERNGHISFIKKE